MKRLEAVDRSLEEHKQNYPVAPLLVMITIPYKREKQETLILLEIKLSPMSTIFKVVNSDQASQYYFTRFYKAGLLWDLRKRYRIMKLANSRKIEKMNGSLGWK